MFSLTPRLYDYLLIASLNIHKTMFFVGEHSVIPVRPFLLVPYIIDRQPPEKTSGCKEV